MWTLRDLSAFPSTLRHSSPPTTGRLSNLLRLLCSLPCAVSIVDIIVPLRIESALRTRSPRNPSSPPVSLFSPISCFIDKAAVLNRTMDATVRLPRPLPPA